jgi:ribonuclease HI
MQIVDGSFLEQNGVGATGIVIRDHLRKVIVAAGCSNAEESEALALIDGLKLASEWTKDPIILESDCISVLTDLQLGKVSLSEKHLFRFCRLCFGVWELEIYLC